MHIILADLSSELLFYEVPFAPSSKTPLQVVAFFVSGGAISRHQ